MFLPITNAFSPDCLTQYFGLTQETWGRDVNGGRYDWLVRPAKPRPLLPGAAEAPDERRP